MDNAISESEPPFMKILVSSANCMNDNFIETFHKSFTYNRKSSGPKMEPWGTPAYIHFSHIKFSIIINNKLLSVG